MKLRNKKTGKILDKICIHICSFDVDGNECKEIDTETRSLEKVLEVWEDYKPAEPLIEDEKIRKAVKAWAEANDFERLEVTHSRKHTLRIMDEKQDVEIFFRKDGMPEIDERVYSLSELCGEEEE